MSPGHPQPEKASPSDSAKSNPTQNAQKDAKSPPLASAPASDALKAALPTQTPLATPLEAPAAAATEKKLTNAQLKAQAKAEKAARRAKAKVDQPAKPDAATTQPNSHAQSQQQQQQQQQKQQSGKGKEASSSRHASTKDASAVVKEANAAAAAAATAEVDPRDNIPACFSHLSVAKRISLSRADKAVHPAVLLLGQQMASFSLDYTIHRLQGTLLAFRKVIESYTPPAGATLARHFTSHVLNPQIEYLTECRPMCFAMGNAIRWLKLQITKLDLDMPELEAKARLCDAIDNMLYERVTLANSVITYTASQMVQNNHHDVILLYASHPLVEESLLRAAAQRRQEQEQEQEQEKNNNKNGGGAAATSRGFRVILIDDPYQRTGADLATRLHEQGGIDVTYYADISAAAQCVGKANIFMVGAEAMFNNGSLYAQAGTADLILAAKQAGVGVYALCHAINFTERVALDSLTYNELDPDHCSAEDGVRLLFDVTPPEYITEVVTDFGATPMATIPGILKKLDEL